MTDAARQQAATADSLLRRALAAYFRRPQEGLRAPGQHSRVTEHAGRQYVVLADTSGVLAVYRIRNNGVLKGLRRWPKAIDEEA